MSKNYSHSHFMAHFKMSGFSLPESGICAGLTQMAIQAFLVGVNEFSRFNARLEHIAEHSPEALKQQIKKFKKGIVARSSQGIAIKLTEEEQILGEIEAFFDGVELYHHPQRHPDLFTCSVAQPQIESIFSYTEYGAWSVQKMIAVVDSFPGIYTRSSLKNYFKKFNEIVSHYTPLSNFCMSLDSMNHRIGLCYDAEQKVWILIDANQLPPKEVSPDQLSEELFKALGSKVGEGSYPSNIAFNTMLYSTEKNQPMVNKWMETVRQSTEYKAAHDITVEKIDRRTDTLKVSLAQIAAKYEHLDTLKTIQAIKPLALNEKGHVGRTAIHVAAQLNLPKVIKVLAESGVALNYLDNENHTPMYLAIADNNKEAVEALLDADPMLASAPLNNKGLLPVNFARRNNQSTIVNLLLREPKLTKQSAGASSIQEEQARQQAEAIKRQEEAHRQEQARQQAEAIKRQEEALRQEQARQQAEAIKRQMSEERTQQLEPILMLLEKLREQADALQARDQWRAQEKIESICNKIDEYNRRYKTGGYELIGYAKKVKKLLGNEDTIAVLSTQRGWGKPVVGLLVNIIAVIAALLTLGTSTVVSYYATGSVFFQPKTTSMKMINALGELATKLEMTTNHPKATVGRHSSTYK